jgi:alpha-beta hydrolase superfamily lysophospholipase
MALLGSNVAVVETDVLGIPYERHTIDLGHDAEGPVTATLVRRRSEQPTGAAALYVHGFADYFFQTHLADFFTARGTDFYAIDLRKYGRSLHPHQSPNHCVNLTEYYPELDEAVRIIRDEDRHDRLLVNGHSMGGLLAALWAHDRREAGVVDALFLNSPWLDFNASWVVRDVVGPLAARYGRYRPDAKLPFGLNEVHGRSIHRHHEGEWDYDMTWKPLKGFPVRAGWLNAIRDGHHRAHAGLDIQVPILVVCSTVSYKLARWGDAARHADSVLDVDQIARWTPALGRHTTLVRVEGGVHDLTLSAGPVRKRLFEETARWLSAYFG